MRSKCLSVPQVAIVMSEDVSSAVLEDNSSARRRRKDRPQKLVEPDFLACTLHFRWNCACAAAARYLIMQDWRIGCALGYAWALVVGLCKQGLVTVPEGDKAF